jgi:hypothetical protein
MEWSTLVEPVACGAVAATCALLGFRNTLAAQLADIGGGKARPVGRFLGIIVLPAMSFFAATCARFLTASYVDDDVRSYVVVTFALCGVASAGLGALLAFATVTQLRANARSRRLTNGAAATTVAKLD